MENFNIIEEKKNPLFKRKEVKFTVDAEVTPNHADTRKVISEKFSTPEENIRIKKILGKFGSRNFTITANIYESEQDKLSTEGESKKDATKEQPAPAEQPAEAPKAPAEPTTPTPEPKKTEESSNKPDKSNKPVPEAPKEETKEETKE